MNRLAAPLRRWWDGHRAVLFLALGTFALSAWLRAQREAMLPVLARWCEQQNLEPRHLLAQALVKAVAEQRADYGVALDGDADRLQLVDATGRLFNGDELLYVLVADRLSALMAVVLAVGARGFVQDLALRVEEHGLGG